MIDEQSICKEMLAYIEKKYGSQSEAARAWGVSPTFVSLVVSGKKRPTAWMLFEAGFVRHVSYSRVEVA